MCVSAHWSGVYPGPPSLDDKLGVRHKCWVGPGSDGSTRTIYALLLSLMVGSVPWTGKAAGKWILDLGADGACYSQASGTSRRGDAGFLALPRAGRGGSLTSNSQW